MPEKAETLRKTHVPITSQSMLRENIRMLTDTARVNILDRFDPVEATVGYNEASTYWRYAYGPYEECLVKDAHLQSAIAVRASSALVRKHALLPYKAGDPLSEELRDFVQAVLDFIGEMDQEAGWQSAVYESLYKGLALGIHIQELIYTERGWNGQRKWFIRRVSSHHPSNFLFDTNHQLRIKQSESDFTGRVAPANKFLILRPYSDYKNLYGQPLVRSVYLPSVLKRFLTVLLANYVESFAQPKPIVELPDDISDDETTDMHHLVDNYINVAGATIPTGGKFQLVGAPAISPQIYTVAFNLLNSEISKGILGQTLSMDAGGSGSYALANVHMRVREDLIQRDVSVLDNFYNRCWIPSIIRVNYPNAENLPLPRMRVYPEIDRLAEIKIDGALAQILQVPASYLRAKYDIPEVQPGEELTTVPPSVSL